MVNLLYIGNKLKASNKNLTGIDTLGPLLEDVVGPVFYASNKENKIYRLLHMVYACIHYRKRVRYVLIDTYSTYNFYYALIISLVCRVLGVNYIPILRGGNLPKRLGYNPYLSRLIFKHAHTNIAPSNYLKNVFERYGYSNLEYIPNTITLNDYPFKDRAIEDVQMLWVRSFSKLYNPKLAVRVLKRLKESGIKASLCMVGPDSGDGSLEDTKQLAKALQVEVKFTGKLSKPEWIALSNDYNVFINTTNFDNMPVSVIEAMALGLPIVSTKVGGMPFLIDHEKDGILVAPDDEQAFTEAIKGLMSNSERTNKMVLNAHQKVAAFDWNHIKTQWINVLK
ncbi:glycosyltransferase family 4 protein [Aestuariivivens insulae]|uniref:glycosyltransferase family 4 protein n=1 Tax=Aestuariivivens insulae TaxID=1621988 RepID=UPI001F590101|nr:glycosyltransferase family 4 protein [Aestuariivivens insulae]